MNRQNICMVAILALALVAVGQEPTDERVEVKVVGPVGGVAAIEPVEVELDGGTFIFGVEGEPQDADQKGKPKKQDAGQDDTIVKEIDLGDGKTMKIIITTRKSGPKGMTRTWVGALDDDARLKGGMFRAFGASPEGVTVLKEKTDAHGKTVFEHDFMRHHLAPHLEHFGQDVKDNLDRALRAFDRARDEFIRAYKEGEGAPRKAPAPKARVKVAKPEALDRVVIGKGEKDDDDKAEAEERAAEKAKKAEADAHAKMVDKIKASMEEELKKGEAAAKAKRGAVQWVDLAPGASTKGEIEALRKEIKELEKMVRDLKDQLEKK
jgi:hypothetical protein